MLDRLRTHLTHLLQSNPVGVLCAEGPTAMPVRFEAQGLDLLCRLPRWSDLAYHLEADQPILLVVPIQATQRWLRYEGISQPAPPVDDLYHTVRLTAIRIDLIDETRGWGARETLELSSNPRRNEPWI